MQGLFDVLDTRSFSSMWYWLLLTLIWTWLGRGALGIPSELVSAVRQRGAAPGAEAGAVAGPDPAPESLLLLDWLSLVTPRWHVPDRDGVVLLGAGCFVATLLAGLGFFYGWQAAQALFLLGAPLMVLVVMRVRLAARLREALAGAEAGAQSPDAAAFAAAGMIARHMRATLVLSVVAVAGAALWGTLWLARHPNWI